MISTQSPDPSNYQILKRLEILEQRVDKIEKERKNQYNWIW